MSLSFGIENHRREENRPKNVHIKHIYENDRQKKIIRKNYISNQYRIASISYALIACLIGLVIATVEPLKTCNFFNFIQ